VYTNSKALAFNLMIVFVYVFPLHVLTTCLDIIFIKTYVYAVQLVRHI